MGNRINNKYEYRSGLLDSLNVQHTASDVMYEDEYRKKVLNGLGVEFTDDDINQNSRYRAKVVEGLASSGGGGGGSSDFSTAEVTLSASGLGSLPIASICDNKIHTTVPFFTKSFEAILYKGSQVCDTSEIVGTITVSGDAVYDSDEQTITITGDCTVTIS